MAVLLAVVRVALGAGAWAAAARPGQREPVADRAGRRGRAPGTARRRGGVAVRLAEGHPHGRQVPAPRLLRRHQLRPRRQPRRARPPWPRRARRHWAWLVKTEEDLIKRWRSKKKKNVCRFLSGVRISLVQMFFLRQLKLPPETCSRV